jgi:pyruvate-ferredoxin/flavodoxin oxidoreductase
MKTAMRDQKAAVDSGQWLLYRYHPERSLEGKNPLQLDSRPPKLPLTEYLRMENRFRMLEMSKPDVADILFKEAQADVDHRWAMYEYLANRSFSSNGANGAHEKEEAHES